MPQPHPDTRAERQPAAGPPIQQKAILVPGAQKSGTTTLYRVLARHSIVAPPRYKEPQFFALDGETVRRHLGWYIGLYAAAPEAVLLDASTMYLHSERAPALIQEAFADPYILIVLRDPARRAYSGYLQLQKKVPAPDQRTFAEVLDALEAGTRHAPLAEAEDDAVAAAVAQGLVNGAFFHKGYLRDLYGAPFETHLEDPCWQFKYFRESQYHGAVARYERTFGNRVKVLFFEEMTRNPDDAIRQVLAFAGLPYEADVAQLDHAYKTRLPKGRLARQLFMLRKRSSGLGALVRLLKKGGLGWLPGLMKKSLTTGKPRLSEADYHRARALLADEYDYWIARHAPLARHWTYAR